VRRRRGLDLVLLAFGAGGVSRARLAAALGLLAAACAGGAPAPTPTRLVDLTHPFDAETIFWPTEEGFVHERGFEGTTEGGYWYAAHRFRSAEHGGTHLDAPVHFGEGKPSADEVPLERLVAPGVVVDASAACAADRDHLIDLDDLAAFEAAHGPIAPDTIVLLRTGFAAHWPDRGRYLGTQRRGPEAVAELHFPGLHPAAARTLVERRVAAVGIDTASIDRGTSRDFLAHRVLAAAEIPVFENVASLDSLPATGFEVIALPMKIRGGSGGPLRIVARVP
jgi:kynurenine formamidase